MTQEHSTLAKEGHLVNQAFSFEDGNDIAVLLFHGWSSTPYEMRALGQYLHEEGFDVHAPLLLGHGTQPEDLEGVHWYQWRNQAQAEYDRLIKMGKKVIVGGMSMGGSLSLLLARENDDVQGVILMSTPYRMRREALSKYLFFGMRPFKKYSTKKYPKIGNGSCLTQKIAYQRFPLTSGYEAYKLISEARKHLHRVTAPTMIIQSEHDHLIQRKSIFSFEWNLGSQHIKKKIISHAYHNFIGDEENRFIFKDILYFLDELRDV